MTREVELDGATVRYDDRGEGAAIVLLHGGLGTRADWAPITARLERAFRVVAPDSRGHGASSNDGRTLSYPLLADDAAALIAALDLRRPTVAGWSDGGQVALELGARHRDLVGALVVGGAFPDFVGSGLHERHRHLVASLTGEPDEELAELASPHADWSELVKQSASMWLSYHGIPDSELAAITVPTLVLAADRDELVDLDLSVALFRKMADAELAVLPQANHESALVEARAEVVASLIADFVRRRH
jgi:3-oxoadipate enol-lactonase